MGIHIVLSAFCLFKKDFHVQKDESYSILEFPYLACIFGQNFLTQ